MSSIDPPVDDLMAEIFRQIALAILLRKSLGIHASLQASWSSTSHFLCLAVISALDGRPYHPKVQLHLQLLRKEIAHVRTLSVRRG